VLKRGAGEKKGQGRVGEVGGKEGEEKAKDNIGRRARDTRPTTRLLGGKRCHLKNKHPTNDGEGMG